MSVPFGRVEAGVFVLASLRHIISLFRDRPRSTSGVPPALNAHCSRRVCERECMYRCMSALPRVWLQLLLAEMERMVVCRHPNVTLTGLPERSHSNGCCNSVCVSPCCFKKKGHNGTSEIHDGMILEGLRN